MFFTLLARLAVLVFVNKEFFFLLLLVICLDLTLISLTNACTVLGYYTNFSILAGSKCVNIQYIFFSK